MNFIKFKSFSLCLCLVASCLFVISCDKDDDTTTTPTPATVDFSGQYTQADQKGRPAVNTVFVPADSKDAFNKTIPSQMGAAYASVFETTLTTLNPGYTTNALTWDATTFSSALATDVLTVSTIGKTTFFDGTNVLTGRALADDVIDVELLLIFGGPDGMANAGLTSDNVGANDKDFLNTFPYLATAW
ncbi:MAG: DUF4331 family protein [Saprospiraceae bacterium]